jgi:adenosylcobyric acid synthase
VNPNTPTGTLLATAELYSLAEKYPETLFWIDESFLAFSDQPSIIELLESRPLNNVVVLTSLSKCLGAPGLRLGYVYSRDTALIDAIGAALPVWNLSSPAEFLLELLVKFQTAYANSLERTAADREALRADLAELPIVARVYPSGGNFLLVEMRGTDDTASAIRQGLLTAHNIEVKDVTDRFSDRRPRLRIAVRLPEENARLVEGLLELPAGVGEPMSDLA